VCGRAQYKQTNSRPKSPVTSMAEDEHGMIILRLLIVSYYICVEEHQRGRGRSRSRGRGRSQYGRTWRPGMMHKLIFHADNMMYFLHVLGVSDSAYNSSSASPVRHGRRGSSTSGTCISIDQSRVQHHACHMYRNCNHCV